MELIAYRYSNYVFLQFDQIVNNLQVILRNAKGEILQRASINNKDFLLINIHDNKEKLKLEVNDHHKILFKKNL
jgi:hypothetical protein